MPPLLVKTAIVRTHAKKMRTAWKPCIKFLILAGLVDGIRKLGRGILTVAVASRRDDVKETKAGRGPL